MIDSVINKRLVVNGEALTGSNIVVPVEQVSQVTDALTVGGVKFWVDDRHINVGSLPPFVRIKLSRTSNTAAVQQMLDAI